MVRMGACAPMTNPNPFEVTKREPHRIQLRRTKGWRMPPNFCKLEDAIRRSGQAQRIPSGIQIQGPGEGSFEPSIKAARPARGAMGRRALESRSLPNLRTAHHHKTAPVLSAEASA